MRCDFTKLDPIKLLLGLVLFLLLTLAPTPAHASHWVITFQCTGKGTSAHEPERYMYGFVDLRAVFEYSYDIGGGNVVYTTSPYTNPTTGQTYPGRPVYAFPTVTHPWADSGSIKPFAYYDASTYHALYRYDNGGFVSYKGGGSYAYPPYGEIQFFEPSTYPAGPLASADYPLDDFSPTVGNPECGHVWMSDEGGTVTPVLTWTPESATDTAPPPLSVTVRECAYAIARADEYSQTSFDLQQIPFTASDGLGDATKSVVVDDHFNPRTGEAVSSGVRMVTADTDGKATITLPSVTLSASGGGGGLTSYHYMYPVQVYLLVQNFDPILASSTADTIISNQISGYNAATVDTDNPLWFSGTGCIVQASANPAYLDYDGATQYAPVASVPVTAYLRSATLRINGQIVRSYPEDYRASNTDTGARLDVMFDSTHFPDNTPLKIEVECHDSLGRSYTTHRTVRTYNKALVLANNTVDNFANTSTTDTWLHVSSVAAQMNHAVVSNEYYHQADILAALPGATAFYIATHGAPQDFGDCFATPSSDTDTDITPGDLAPAVHLKVSSNLPPYNFVQLDSCEAGTTDLALPFLTGFTAPLAGPIGADRAFLGFTDPVEICGGNGDWTERVWDYLSQGATLNDAVRISTSHGKPYGGVISLPLTDVDIPLGILSHPIRPIIYGDGTMTLHGVFGGQTSWQFGNDGFEADLQWYKPL